MIYFRYLLMNLRSLLEYRLTTWLIALGHTLNIIFTFLGIGMLFERFGNVAGWTFADVGLCYGATTAAFSLSECLARGFDVFSGLIIRGEFDRVLLRPRNTIIQVLGAKTDVTRLSKLVVSAVILCIVIPRSGIVWTPAKAVTLAFMVFGGAAVFFGIFVLGAAFTFFTLEGLEVINIFTDGGRELASYPLPVYGKWVARFFTFIIPLGCINYLPLMYLTGRAAAYPALYMLSPLAGFLFVLPCLLAWRVGVRHYTSSGS